MAHQVSDHLEPWRDLHGKVVMVTGASSGLGLDFCLDLAKAGCRIVAVARRIDRLQSLCDQINNLTISSSSSSSVGNGPGSSPRAVAVELDVSADGSVIEKSVQKAWNAFGKIDALINNAGVRGNVRFALELSEEEWNHVFRTNLTGSWLVSKYVALRMRDADKGGSIINISSIAGLNRGYLPGAVAYNTSKAGVNVLTKVMALELGTHKIRVNAISPGLFRSEITEGLMQKDWLHTVAEKTVPLRTFGTSDPALTSLVRYLIHDSSEYVSGNIYIVDAGVTLPGYAVELGAHNIRVNAISPGIFKSEITEDLMKKDWLLRTVATRIVPLRTIGTSDRALTSLVCYLYTTLLNMSPAMFSLLTQEPPCQVFLFSLPFEFPHEVIYS